MNVKVTCPDCGNEHTIDVPMTVTLDAKAIRMELRKLKRGGDLGLA